MTIDPNLILILATFLLAGMVKGVIGLGLPTISLAILTVALDLPGAMALLLVPSFITNLWQAVVGGNSRLVLARTWPFLLMATVTIWFGAQALRHVQLSMLSALLGILLTTYAVANLSGLRFTISRSRANWAGPLLGLVNGLLTGMTGSFVVPGVMYLQALGFTRDELLQAMGMLFTLSTLALALQSNELLSVEQGIHSTIALLPAIMGMLLGQRIRSMISESLFSKVFFVSLLAMGVYIIVTALGDAA